jgi:hypothetical protein
VSGACLNGRTPQTLSSDNTFCPQYSQSSCCDPSYVEYSCTFDDGCRKVPDQCSYLQGLFYCGLACNPLMSNYLSNGQINVCANYYDATVNACENVKQCPSNSTNCHTIGPPSPLCENVYSSPSDVWAVQIGPVTYQYANRVSGTSNCFASALIVLPSLGTLAVLLALAVLI